jgi:Ca-activated chloride channel family protein
VLARLQQSWREDRKPANVMLVLDTSLSMARARRLESAKKGVGAFLGEAAREDRVGLMTFSDQIQTAVPLGTVRDIRTELERAVSRLIAMGGTAFYDATVRAFERVQRIDDDGERINAVVLLTDGDDTDSELQLADVLERLDQGDSEYPVRVFTIAYSAEASGAREALKDIAEASGGGYYVGDTEDIETVFRKISSFF